MARIQKDPKVISNLEKLKKFPINLVRKTKSVIIDIPIGELSLKNSHRAIYVLSSAIIQLKISTDVIQKEFLDRELAIKKLIDRLDNSSSSSKRLTQNQTSDELKLLLSKKEELESATTVTNSLQKNT